MPPSSPTPPRSGAARPVDVAGLAAELRALRKELLAERSTEPLAHLAKIERWGRANHTGLDMTRWDAPAKTSDEFYLRQIVGSTNYACGDDLTDFLHGFLNYQIEHHVFPDLSMLEYQRIQPRVRALCEKYGVPYVQESVFARVRKTVDVMIGKTSMLRG
jgi:hypothetical protein